MTPLEAVDFSKASTMDVPTLMEPLELLAVEEIATPAAPVSEPVKANNNKTVPSSPQKAKKLKQKTVELSVS